MQACQTHSLQLHVAFRASWCALLMFLFLSFLLHKTPYISWKIRCKEYFTSLHSSALKKMTQEKQVNTTWYIVVQDDKLNSGFGPSPFDRPHLTVTIQHVVHIFQSISNKFNTETERSWNSGASKNKINYSVNNSKLHFKQFYSPMIWTCNHLHMGPQY